MSFEELTFVRKIVLRFSSFVAEFCIFCLYKLLPWSLQRIDNDLEQHIYLC